MDTRLRALLSNAITLVMQRSIKEGETLSDCFEKTANLIGSTPAELKNFGVCDSGLTYIVMDLDSFQPNDMIRLTVYDCFSGTAIVKVAEKERLVADWIEVSPCYDCQTMEETSVEITKKHLQNDSIAELVLLKRCAPNEDLLNTNSIL